MTARLVASLLVLVAVMAMSCSDNGVTLTEPAPAPLQLDLLPLAQGTTWTYSFYMMESCSRSTPEGLRLTNKRTYGTMSLSVTEEIPGGFTRSWRLKSVFDVDSVRAEDFLDYELLGLSGNDNLLTYTNEYSIFFEHDTLWYSEDGVLEYMMPGRYMPGGTINLKIFNWPGTDYFQKPLPFSAEWASGDKVYLSQNQKLKTAAKIGASEGIIGVWVASQEPSENDPRDQVEREFYFSLVDISTPGLASGTGRN